MQALELLVTGAIQGVGFRPFVYRLARELGLGGAVWNEPRGVRVRAVGPARVVEEFCWRVKSDAPAPARVDALHVLEAGTTATPEVFRIAASDNDGERSAVIMADLATCPACLRELFDPSDRRHRYPFINCTHCGPRYSILLGLPYDRPNTTMRGFTLCDACRAEYGDPANRRFHAQPNACPVCGPQLELWDAHGAVIEERNDALLVAAEAVRCGQIVAVKGIGGFHLLCDARNDGAVRELRRRKHREEKPLALMAPDLATIRALCEVGDLDASLLHSAETPIMILPDRASPLVAPSVAPGNPCLGVMLPYTPLHHLLLRDLGFPVVATSGNVSDEPICIDNEEARRRLGGIADFFLVHNRPIARHLDDSIVRMMAGKPCVLRRSRGYAPLPIPLHLDAPSVVAAGAQLKNTIALALGHDVVLSQHIGDLDALEARRAFERVADDLQDLYAAHPERWVVDLHPDYASTQHGRSRGRDVLAVQHHHAHVASCMAEHGIDGPALGVAWDGTGLGADGTIWGGEFLICERRDFRRFAHLRTFLLPGGDQAVREPRRSALGVLFALHGAEAPKHVRTTGARDAFSRKELGGIMQMLEKGVRTVATSSAGRLFDAVASLVGLRQVATFEGQAAMELEWAIGRPHAPADDTTDVLHFDVRSGDPLVVDWQPAIDRLLRDLAAGIPANVLARMFHLGLVEMIVDVARRAELRQVALTGGCFQNQFLAEHAIARLRAEGFEPLWHQLVPPNDGGISLGQAAIAAYA